MGIEPDAAKLIKPMYGQVGAPRRWWQRALDDRRACGLKQHPLGPCVSAVQQHRSQHQDADVRLQP
eukprot:4586304-Pyramimonas_sp.AAC.1